MTKINFKNEPEKMYYVSHKTAGYIVQVTYSLKEARLTLKALNKFFSIYDETGREVK